MFQRHLAVLVLALLAPCALRAQGLSGYNVLTFGGFSQMYTEVNGSLAVGGNLSSIYSGLGTNLKGPQPLGGLVVAGNATIVGGNLPKNTVIAGTRALANVGHTNNLMPRSTPLPVNFQSEYQRLYDQSMQIAAMASNATVTAKHGQLFFYGTAGTNVFTVTQAQLASAYGGYNFHAPSGSTMIINVTGLSSSTLFANAGFNFCSFASSATKFSNCTQPQQTLASSAWSNVLWNLSTPTQASVSFASMRGSLLAPNVNISANWGSCVGDIVAQSISSTCEFYQNRYTGTLPTVTQTATVPEPSTVVLFGVGALALGAVARRKRS